VNPAAEQFSKIGIVVPVRKISLHVISLSGRVLFSVFEITPKLFGFKYIVFPLQVYVERFFWLG
jgi:hypothetical protein